MKNSSDKKYQEISDLALNEVQTRYYDELNRKRSIDSKIATIFTLLAIVETALIFLLNLIISKPEISNYNFIVTSTILGIIVVIASLIFIIMLFRNSFIRLPFSPTVDMYYELTIPRKDLKNKLFPSYCASIIALYQFNNINERYIGLSMINLVILLIYTITIIVIVLVSQIFKFNLIM